MSTIKSSAEHLTLNADGASKDIKFQANGVEVASISSTGNVDVTGNLYFGTENNGRIYSDVNWGCIFQADESTPNNAEFMWENGSSTERLRIDTTGNLKVNSGDLFFGTAGKGIVLGATTNVDANTLDDYEEGTFTAALTTSNSNVTFSNGATFTCSYTKVGRLVTCIGYSESRVITAVGSGTPRITGLPFTCLNATEGYSVASIGYNSMFTGSVGYVEINATHLVVVLNESITPSAYTGTGDKRLMFTISYITA